jgi:two-component system sensor kinase FixL
LLFYPAIAMASLLGGVGSGAMTIALAVVAVHAPISGNVADPINGVHDLIILGVFLFNATVLVTLARLPRRLVTAWRSSEALFRLNAEQLGHLIEQAPAAMAMFDCDMRYIAASARWRADYDLDQDLRGKSAYDVLPETLDEWKKVHRRVLAGENVRSDLDLFVRPDGRRQWLRWEARPWRDLLGEIGGIVIVAEDVSERRRFQLELEEQQRRLTAVFETAMEAIVTADRHGVIQSVNPAALEIFGYAGDKLVGRNLAILMPEKVGSQHDRYIAGYLRTGVKKIIGQRRVVEGRRKDGSLFPLEISVREAALADGPLFVGVMRDLSPIEAERRRVSALRDELARVSRVNDMGEMAAGLAHEVGQPVAAILNFSAAYRRAMTTTGKPSEGELIGKIEAQARRAAEILKRLRGFIEKRPPERQAMTIDGLIDDALQLVVLRSRPRLLRGPVPPELAGSRIFVDPIQIEQVLISLLRNADDAVIETDTPEIMIETCLASTRRLRVSVADNGAGVAPEAADELFSPFFTTKILGMGVGLSISKSIVESHGGVIGYRPNAPRGSIFEFELPITEGVAHS